MKVNYYIRHYLSWCIIINIVKTRHVNKLAAIIPSTLVTLAHYALSVSIAPHANVVFQHWSDTGEYPTGIDAVISNINLILSLPIPALPLFGIAPSYLDHGLTTSWWATTIANSIIWGLMFYAIYVISDRIFVRERQS